MKNLTPKQLEQLIDMYANDVVDNMDMKTMERFVYDVILENLSVQSDNDILDTLYQHYDKDEYENVLKRVGANPKDFEIDDELELSEEDKQFLRDSVKKSNQPQE